MSEPLTDDEIAGTEDAVRQALAVRPDGQYPPIITNERVAQLVAEIRCLRARLRWHPVATAPRDGTAVVVFVRSPEPPHRGFRQVANFQDGHWRIGYGYGRLPWEPTLWTPLPEAP